MEDKLKDLPLKVKKPLSLEGTSPWSMWILEGWNGRGGSAPVGF